MREAKIVVDLIEGELLPHPLLALTQRADPSPQGSHMLADREIDALHEGGIDLPTVYREHLLDGLKGPKHHTVCDADQALAAHGLDHLRIEQLGQGHPAWLWCCTLGV